MKCPKCGTKNADTNKFCRECGLSLAGVVDQVKEKPVSDNCPPDEAALSAEVLEVMQLYSAGELDKALVKAENVTKCNPESASAHSLVGLIYERKGEQELLIGSTEAGRDFYKLAIEHYEKILELNPHSAADREKLASLKRKISGESDSPSFAGKLTGVINYVKSCYRMLPVPARIAAAVFFVVLLITFTVISAGKGKQERYARDIGNKTNIPSPKIDSPQKPAEPQFRVYTFNAPTTTNTQAAETPPTPAPPAAAKPVPTPATTTAAGKPSSSVEPMKLPALSSITIVPEPKNKKKTADVKPGSEPRNPESKISITTKPDQPSNASQSNGASSLAEAIRLNNQGKTNDAIGMAQQAISEFQADLAAGRNTSSATRGIENAKKMIKLWQGS